VPPRYFVAKAVPLEAAVADRADSVAMAASCTVAIGCHLYGRQYSVMAGTSFSDPSGSAIL
jgi:hypothetical protein